MRVQTMSQTVAHETVQLPRQPTDDKIEALAQKARKRLLLLQILAERERGGAPFVDDNYCVANDEFPSECGNPTASGGDDGCRVFWNELESTRHDWFDTDRHCFMNCRMRDEVDVKKLDNTERDSRQHAQIVSEHESMAVDDDIRSPLASTAAQLRFHLDKMDIEGGGSVSRVFTSRIRAYLLEYAPVAGLLYLERGIDGADYILVMRKLTDGRVLLRTLQK